MKSFIPRKPWALNIIVSLFVLTSIPSCGGGGGGGGGGGVESHSVTITWEAPKLRVDGSPLLPSEIAGFRIFHGTVSRFYTDVIDVGNTTMFTFHDLTPGVLYYFAVIVYDTEKLESEFSNEVSRRVP